MLHLSLYVKKQIKTDLETEGLSKVLTFILHRVTVLPEDACVLQYWFQPVSSPCIPFVYFEEGIRGLLLNVISTMQGNPASNVKRPFVFEAYLLITTSTFPLLGQVLACSAVIFWVNPILEYLHCRFLFISCSSGCPSVIHNFKLCHQPQILISL